MAIRIPILTSFDPKGLRQANAQFAKLQGSIGSLGRNFAVAGAAIAGAGAIIAKNAQSLARIERINAQTAQTITSMGNASNISAKQVEELAGSLEKLTATEAETIQEGANLLLTFKNISNQAGEGNDIFNQTAGIMVDLARAMGTSASGEAIRLGKALNDPVKGIAALTRVGVSFTEQQKEQIKALAQSGDLLGAQKIILAELQAQFGGSGAAYAKTFSGQLELMGHELGTIGEEATMAVMPALQGMVEQLRELIPVIGPKLKAAIESVDWKALTASVVGLTTFLIQNAETIGRVILAVFALNTAFKLMAIASGIAKTAIAVQTYVTAQMATGLSLATVALKIFRTALITTGVGALVVGLGFLIEKIMGSEDAATDAVPAYDAYGTAIQGTGAAAGWAATKYGIAQKAAKGFAGGLASIAGQGKAARNALRDLNRAAGKIPGSQRNDEPDTDVDYSGAKTESAAEKAARKEKERLAKRREAFKSFRDAVKQTFAQIKDSILSSFSLPSLGNSIDSITKNIGKLLQRTRTFASNISKLAELGLNPQLLNQIIQAGPLAGGQLAAALAAGGGGAISDINASYSEFGELASGIAGTGTGALFGTQQTVNNYSISVTGGVATAADVGRAVVNAIKSFEKSSGSAWRA
jgi:methyl-accepting chemotaxis protein